MSGARVSRCRVGEFDAVALENRFLRAVIVPSLGGRVWELTDLRTGRQWIWQRRDVALSRQPVGACYDDVWAGGWEELFPNDAPGVFEGRDLPDHGEWWALPWDVTDEQAGGVARLRLRAKTTVIRARCEKTFTLAADEPVLTVDYRLLSEEQSPFHFLFKQHLPVELAGQCRLRLPGGTVEVVDPAFGTLLGDAKPFAWPVARREGQSIDMQVVPPEASRHQEFVYVTALPESWCGVEDLASGATLRMDYDGDRFPYVWLFLSYGGWRGTHTAVLEPCTNLPKDLAEAVRRGQSARLGPGETFSTTVRVTLGRRSA